MTLGMAIKLARTALRMTQRDMAAYIGASESAVQSWESGRHFPPADMLHRVGVVTGVSFAIGAGDGYDWPEESTGQPTGSAGPVPPIPAPPTAEPAPTGSGNGQEAEA